MIADDPPRLSRITFRDGSEHSGLVVRSDGRLSLVDRGSGFSVQLGAEQLLEVGRQCIAVAALLAERERAAADEAAADLARVQAHGNG